MSQIVFAAFEDGVLKPDSPLELGPSSRVRLVVEPLASQTTGPEVDVAWWEIERLWNEIEFHSGGPPPGRDQRYVRR